MGFERCTWLLRLVARRGTRQHTERCTLHRSYVCYAREVPEEEEKKESEMGRCRFVVGEADTCGTTGLAQK